MKKAKIYKPAKTAMQSGLGKNDKWIVEYIAKKPGTNPLMGWESSTDTLSELKLEFSSKDILGSILFLFLSEVHRPLAKVEPSHKSI